MEPKELIIAVINKYETAQEISKDLPAGNRPHLKRGNKHVLSSYLEDITAAFIADLLSPASYEIWIDQTFYFGKSKSHFRPDITIVKKREIKTIVGFIEVKESANPFRWNSENDQNKGIEYINKRVEKLLLYRGNLLRYITITNHSIEIEVSKSAKLDLVLFSDQLYSSQKLTAFKEAFDKNFICLHILLNGFHPNVKHMNYTAEQLISRVKNDNPKGIYNELSLRQRLEEIQQL